MNNYSMSAHWIWDGKYEARSAELAITSLISNKREWNNCFIKFLNSKNLKYEIRAKKNEKIHTKLKNTEDAMLWSDRRRLITKNTSCFLAFSRIPKRRHWSKLSKNKFFPFFGFIQRKILLSGENIFSLATLTGSAIIYHIRSN